MKNFKIADINPETIYTVTTVDHEDGNVATREMTGADLVSFTQAAGHMYDIHATEFVATYKEWCDAIIAEGLKLNEMMIYLNSAGLDRACAFENLVHLAGFCDSAKELAEWIDSKASMSKEQIADLASPHAALPLKRLRRIAAMEK